MISYRFRFAADDLPLMALLKKYQPLSECYKTVELDMFEDRACIIVIEQVLRSRVDNIFGYWNIQPYFSGALAGTRSESH